MDYAVYRNNAFIAGENFKKQNKLSPSVKKRQEFLHSHNFSVKINETTNTAEIIASPREDV